MIKKSYALLAKLTILTFAFAQMASAATTYYVTTNGTGNLSGTDWANATNNLQGAIDAIESGAANTVWVSNGVYEVGGRTNYPSGTLLTNRVVIDKAITVRSANNDPANTIIKGAWDAQTNGPTSVRCVYMTNGSTLIGFMLTNGATLSTNETSTLNARRGGGIYSYSTNTIISNCVMTGNAANYEGGGTYQGTLYSCTLTGNKHCLPNGGGGGGSANGTLYDCRLTENSGYSGGASVCILYNCILTGNSGGSGAGARDGTLYNCTIVSNSATSNGGGVRDSVLYNCISWGNSKVDYQPTAYYSCGVGYTNGGSVSGNITNNPLFVSSDTGDYHLNNNSPCVNTGTNFSWMTDPADVRSKDLDGRSRIDKFSSRPDMGCYEHLPSGTMLKVR